MAKEKKIYRLWKPISYNEIWDNCDTSILDDISSSWLSRRAVLQENSTEYAEFINQKKREHAIETGVIERLYDLSKGVTETFIKEGFVESYLSHGDTDIPKRDLMNHLSDHIEAVDFIFDVVNENRPLTTGFIKELHHLTTRHQKHAEGRDQFGNKSKIDLLKGTYKVRENNPTRGDGTVIHFCPPEQTASEMDNLIEIYNKLVTDDEHPLKIATWLHHAFVSIHPFQDGNGRVARLLTSLVFIKFGFFPFTVLREESKVKYINALEAADDGQLQNLVSYFGETQKRNIEKALNIREVVSTSLEEVESIFIKKLEKRKEEKDFAVTLLAKKNEIFEFCSQEISVYQISIFNKVNQEAQFRINKISFGNSLSENHQELDKQNLANPKIIKYTEKNEYHFNPEMRKAWISFVIELPKEKKYELIIAIHHYGYEENTLAIGTIISFHDLKGQGNYYSNYKIPPHIISIDNDFEPKKKNIKSYLENSLTMFLAQIANEI